MSELPSRPSLEEQIKQKFEGYTDGQIMRRMEAAEDFGYDDEAMELNRRLGAVGLTWRWSKRNKVLIYDPEQES
jgi:hypothetical protein